MIEQVRFSSDFRRAFKQLKKRYRSLPDDFNRVLLSLTDNPYQGDELYDGMRKVRIAFTSKGRGKRGGGFRLSADGHAPQRGNIKGMV